MDLAKEWACSNNENNGFANKYSIDTIDLKILDLTDKRYSILNWVAILLKHRSFDLSNEISKQAKDYLIKYFYIDVNEYDIVNGYRADDSYFTFARDFINNTISVRQLSKAMELGQLGKQVVIISKFAFEKLHFDGFKTADKLEYYIKRKGRDELERNEYLNVTRKDTIVSDDLFIIDIIRKGIKDGDTNL